MLTCLQYEFPVQGQRKRQIRPKFSNHLEPNSYLVWGLCISYHELLFGVRITICIYSLIRPKKQRQEPQAIENQNTKTMRKLLVGTRHFCDKVIDLGPKFWVPPKQAKIDLEPDKLSVTKSAKFSGARVAFGLAVREFCGRNSFDVVRYQRKDHYREVHWHFQGRCIFRVRYCSFELPPLVRLDV